MAFSCCPTWLCAAALAGAVCVAGPVAADEKKEADMAAKVQREDGRVWIDGVKPAKGGMSSVMQASATILQAMGEDVSYDWLMGVSGHAFRTQMAHPGWCPSSPHAYCGFDCWKVAQDALPFRVVGYDTCKDGKPDPELVKKAQAALVASIDKGIPVQFGSEEDTVAVGYADGGKIILAIGEGGGPMKEVRTPPWGLQVYAERKTPAPRKELIQKSLDLAMKLWNTEVTPAASGPKQLQYASGAHAWEVWIAGLADDAKFERMNDKREDPDGFFGNCCANAWTLRSLLSARKAASGYLVSIAGDFPGPAGDHLRKAAELYLKVFEALRPAQRCAPFPWEIKGKEQWTKEMRAEQSKLMKQAFELDRQAFAELDATLKAAAK